MKLLLQYTVYSVYRPLAPPPALWALRHAAREGGRVGGTTTISPVAAGVQVRRAAFALPYTACHLPYAEP